MIEVLKETTDWEYPSGIYYVNEATELVAFKSSTGEYREYKKPIRGFSKARRTFKHLGFIKEASDENVKIVTGSKGDKYTIVNGRCSCPGFKYRNKCRHLEMA